MPNSRVCVDSNVVIKRAVDEDASDAVRTLWERWERDDIQIVAPTLVWYEIASSLRKKVVREALTEDEAGDALDKLLRLQLSMLSIPGHQRRAWEMANELDRPQAYDSHYLAVAEYADCPFWTADRRLYNAVKDKFKRIHLIT